MKTIKPDDMALVQRTMRRAGQDWLSLGLMALFTLDEPHLDTLRPEAQLWQLLPTVPAAPAVLDEGWPKARPEFMLYGEACAPGGQPVDEVPVSVRVGPCKKALMVRGDRHWTAWRTPSAPVPFVRMPITPPAGPDEAALPHAEDPHRPVVFKSDRPAPAGFWGVDSSAPQRLRALGALDEAWLRTTWPHLPSDTREAFFQSAPEDQRLQEALRGDEEIELQNLHPERAWIASRLPGLRARCFAWRGAAATARSEEVAMRPETLWLLPGLGLGVLLYRGMLAVDDEDALDVETLVMGWESMGDPPKPAAHYLQQRPARNVSPEPSPGAAVPAPGDAPAQVLAGAPPASTGAVAGAGAAAAAMATAAALPELPAPQVALDPELVALRQLTQDMQTQTDQLLREHGIPRDQLDTMMRPVEPPQLSLDELQALRDSLQAQTDALMADSGITQADVDAHIAASRGEPPAQMDLEQFQALSRSLRAQTAELMHANGIDQRQVAEHLRAQGASGDAIALMQQWPAAAPDVSGFPVEAALAAAPGRVAAGLHAVGGEAVAVHAPDSPAAPRAAAPPPQPEPPALPEPEPGGVPRTRDEVRTWHAQGRSFAGLDLAGLDLRELDLSGADFSEAGLEGCMLENAQLQDCGFRQADLRAANLAGARLLRADLSHARAAGSCFARAALDGASLQGADFTGADFEAATLEQAVCTDTDFSRSRMAGLQARGMHAERATFEGCDLARAQLAHAVLVGANLDGAQLPDACLAGIRAERSEWHGVQAERCNLADADLRAARGGADAVFSQADLSRADLTAAAWDGRVRLDGANLHLAWLDGADLSGAQAAGASLLGASARGTNFSRADLRDADGRGANLMGASLRRAALERCRFEGSNLHEADLQGSNVGRARTTDAILTGTLLGLPGLPGRPEAQA